MDTFSSIDADSIWIIIRRKFRRKNNACRLKFSLWVTGCNDVGRIWNTIKKLFTTEKSAARLNRIMGTSLISVAIWIII